MSRFFRATRTILGRCYKPTICMVSAVSLYSLPALTTVSAATTMDNQKPSLTDIIETMEKPTKSTNPINALADPVKIISNVKKIIESDTSANNKALCITCALLPAVIEGYTKGYPVAKELMKQTHQWFIELSNDPNLESTIGKENVLRLGVLRVDHKQLVMTGYETMIVVLEECRDQKTNMEYLLSLIQKRESKSAFSESEEQEYNDCLYDLSEWAKQKSLNLFWDKCSSFQTDALKLKEDIDEIKDRETTNKFYTGLKYAAGFAVAGTGHYLDGKLETELGIPKQYSNYITGFMKAMGPTIVLATYWYDNTLSLTKLLQMRRVSNELSEIIQHCQILQSNKSEVNANSKYTESRGKKLENFESIGKIKVGLSRMIKSLGKFEAETQKMVQKINEIRKHCDC